MSHVKVPTDQEIEEMSGVMRKNVALLTHIKKQCPEVGRISVSHGLSEHVALRISVWLEDDITRVDMEFSYEDVEIFILSDGYYLASMTNQIRAKIDEYLRRKEEDGRLVISENLLIGRNCL